MPCHDQSQGPDRTAVRVVIVDDDAAVASLCAEAVRTRIPGCQVAVCRPDCATLGVKVAWAEAAVCAAGATGETRVDVLARVLLINPELPVVVLLPPESPEAAFPVIGAGAAGVVWRAPGYLEQVPCAVLSASRRGATRRTAALARTLAEINAENRTLQSLVERLEAVAMTDPLTGLANRRALEARAEELFAAATRYRTELSCLVIDLDGLKAVNDTLGHQAGDELICAAADTLRAGCRKADFAARHGGDEFVALLPHASATVARRVAHRLQGGFAQRTAELARRLAVASPGAHVGMSLGISSRLLSHPNTPAMLLGEADAALYAAKRSGKGAVETFGGATAIPAGGIGLARAG